MRRVYQCENCDAAHRLQDSIYYCIMCHKEVCENCLYDWGHCKECAKDIDKAVLRKRWEEVKGEK